MNSHRFVLLLIVVLLASCRQQSPQKVILLAFNGGRILNGNVKEVFTDDAGYFEIAHFDEQGNLKNTKHWLIYFDDTNKPIKTDTAKLEYSSLYDNDGNKIAVTANRPGSSVRRSKWEFDKKGQVVNCVPDLSDTVGRCITFRYSTTGDLIESHYIHFFMPDSSIYKYNSDHIATELDVYQKNSIITKVTFKDTEFDSHKNWTKCILRIRNFNPGHLSDTSYTATRKIAYY